MIAGLKEAEKVVVVTAGTLLVFVLRGVLLHSQNIIRCGDEWKESNNDGGDPNCLEKLTAATSLGRDRARGAYSAHQCHCPEKSPGQIKGRVELQSFKNTM